MGRVVNQNNSIISVKRATFKGFPHKMRQTHDNNNQLLIDLPLQLLFAHSTKYTKPHKILKRNSERIIYMQVLLEGCW
jgi:hypothetical protein